MRILPVVCVLAGLGAYFGLPFTSEEITAPPSSSAQALNATGEAIAVPDSKITFLSKAKPKIGDKEVNLTLTGTALRTKFTIKVYAMGSYIEDGAAVRTAAELAAADKIKMLHLIMERKATGTDFIDAFRSAVGKDRVKSEFAAEFAKLSEGLGKAVAEKGETILMYSLPGVGTRICVGDSVDVTIPGAAFGRAIWETYLGAKPISDDIRTGLVSRIAK